jgi:hypothetical protein
MQKHFIFRFFCRQARPATRLFIATCLATFLAAAFAPAQDTFKGVKHIIAIGDVHGEYDRFVNILRTAQLIDRKNEWAGGKTHLVMVGDLIDRGPASAKVMDLLMNLEPQARRAGGYVHVLLGNHEAMNIYGDLRYVSKEDFESYRTPDSEHLRDKALELAIENLKQAGNPTADEETFRKEFESKHPLGWVEQRLAFSPEGKYGKWLRKKNVIIKINDLIFVHGGISPKYATKTRKEFNETVRAELNDLSKISQGMTTDPDGPLWYRGLAELPENDPVLVAHIDNFLRLNDAHHIVIGHTPAKGITLRFGGKVIQVDVGLVFSKNSPEAFLEVKGSDYYAVQNGLRAKLLFEATNAAQLQESYPSILEAVSTYAH